MEDVGVIVETAFVDPSFWRSKRVFLTGHTGFKGSWLSLWLQSLGAEVHGLSLAAPTSPNLFTEARVGECVHSMMGDNWRPCSKPWQALGPTS